VLGHKGRLTVGHWAGKAVLVAEGRLHYYEGHDWDTVTRPIRLAASLGVRQAILTNAAGGMRAHLVPGSLMPIQDHLEWNRPYPWREPPRPSPYAAHLLEHIVSSGKAIGLDLTPGIYAAVTGPSYETPAEIRALQSVGAWAVGMSTSREVLAGAEAGLECAAVSLITNRAAGLSAEPLAHSEVLEMGRRAGLRLGELLEVVVRNL
jgi:purine-nucleoside phosphorylase